MTTARLAAMVATVAIAFATPALSQETRVSSDGHEYLVETNRHGAVLRSRVPVVRPPSGAFAGFEGTEIVYLGNSCDAFSEVYGQGRWSWANGGFVIEFPLMRIGFPRQERPVDDGQRCRM